MNFFMVLFHGFSIFLLVLMLLGSASSVLSLTASSTDENARVTLIKVFCSLLLLFFYIATTQAITWLFP